MQQGSVSAQRGIGVVHRLDVVPILRVATAITVSLFVAVGSAFAAVPCDPPETCAKLQVGSGTGQGNQTVPITVTFAQGPDNGQAGSGNDDIAAIAFTLGAPATGQGAPLILPCVNSGDGSPNKLAPDAVTVAAAIDSDFRVVVENAECVNRDHCLCPGDGQQRDDYVNVVVYGPKELPDQGPVDIPILPDGLLLTINFQVAAGSQAQTVPLHVFSQTDNGAPPKPQFGALASIGDQSAVDQTVGNTDMSQIIFTDGEVTIEVPPCTGDCNGDGIVQINELVIGVNIALGLSDIAACSSLDLNDSGAIEIDELITAVGNALEGCP